MKARKWMMEYGVAMISAMLCAAVLGHLPLFRETALGKLHASDLVQFIGYGGAMVIALFGARQIAADPPDDWKWLMPYRTLVLPTATLATTALAYRVVLYVCDPYLGKPGREMYNWVFVIGLIAACVWLIVTWVLKCAPQISALESRRLKKAA